MEKGRYRLTHMTLGRLQKRILVSVAIVIIELSLIAVGLEVYLRSKSTYVISQRQGTGIGKAVVDPELLIVHTPKGKRLLPNVQVIVRNHFLSHQDVTITTNAFGFRDEEMTREKKEGEVRILVLGDSITWGDSLDATDVYVEQAQARLREQYPGKSIEVINAGIGDIGLLEELDILKDQGLQLAPDVVVVGFYLNDSRPPWGLPQELGRRGFLRRHSVLAETIYQWLKLKNILIERGIDRGYWWFNRESYDWQHDRTAFLAFADSAKLDWGVAWDERSWASLTGPFDELAKLSRDHGFRVVLLAFPVRYQVDAPFIEDLPQRKLREVAEMHGWSYLDLLPVLRQHQAEDLYFDQAHPNARGNALIGQVLADYLMTNGLIQP